MLRIIAHLDMDAFFAAIEERDNPRFADMPIVVGADPKEGRGRGVVSTANYKARQYGIHSAMPISSAWRLVQAATKVGKTKTIFLPVNGPHYAEVSEKIMKILQKYASCIEQTSIDEAYLDLSFTGSFEAAIALIQKIKEEIKVKERLTASVGIGPNKLLSKIASGRRKPDGLTVITPSQIESFLEPLSIREIPGIGPKTGEFLNQKKIFKVADLKKVPQENLVSWLGKWGSDLYEKVRGIDDLPLEVIRKIKSISEQETFETDTLSPAFLIERLNGMATRVISRMKAEKVLGFKNVTVMVRFFDFETKSRSHTLTTFSSSLNVLQIEALKLFLPFLDRRENPKRKPIRLIGVGIENFKKDENQNQEESERKKKATKTFQKVMFPCFDT